MLRNVVTLGLAGLLVLPLGAQAQHRGTWVYGPRGVIAFSTNRARLGVTVQVRANPETDKYGARIESVLPDGPADKAGIKAGDIITRFNGTSLANARPEDDDDDDNASGPGRRLVELARKLDEGDTVRVEYRRDGQTHTATIVAEEIEPEVALRQFMPNLDIPWSTTPDGGSLFRVGPDNTFRFFMNGAGLGLHLVDMNADLGDYFGTSDGVLVTRTPTDSTIPLRAGDVILSIDGRKPTSAAHALRILQSYDQGETVNLEIMRKRQRSTVEYKVERSGPWKTRNVIPLERTRKM